MPPSLVHLPNGQVLTVSPVFGGLFFKANDLTTSHSIFPAGWTIILNSEDDEDDHKDGSGEKPATAYEHDQPVKAHHVHRYRTPTLHSDNLFISSISNPSNSEFRPPTSPTRQIAMMLWATLWWYFHQAAPDDRILNNSTSKIPVSGRPKGEWRINIKREGIFKGKHLLPKLERMGLIASEDSYVGAELDDRRGEGWTQMFVSKRSFWQLDGRIFLFTLSPNPLHSPFPGSPYPSRPTSPSREGTASPRPDRQAEVTSQGLWSSSPGPFASGSHLPTYYPPAPALYTDTNGIRHPIRPKPPRQGEVFYTRYVPSLGQYLSFRIPSLSHHSPAYQGPVSCNALNYLPPSSGVFPGSAIADSSNSPSDTELLNKWMNEPRVAAAWGVSGPISTQEAFLKSSLNNKHSVPVIGCWDGKPFGFFEIYWVKEDKLGRYAGGDVGDYDRGIHALVGPQEYRGEHRAKVWLSALVHYCWLADNRTSTVMMEPRIDNQKYVSPSFQHFQQRLTFSTRFIGYLHDAGFYKEKEIAFPFKQAALMKIKREAWDAPAL